MQQRYIGESLRRLKTRITEHKRDCQLGNSNSSLFQHAWAKESIAYKRKIVYFLTTGMHINDYQQSIFY